ncbi:probable calcium-binding protein CML18 [Papaver somniferum]|uniref:probable calcium-binding protein CML18 n=1 Tax=Papaver somniferum TaxID=3469 RepID=UPI000E7002DE|nr:probable calcium-binding protein CML18 [Papaver somniferum]
MSSSGKKYSVSLENMEEVEGVFKRFDANGDGKISSTELSDVLKALGSETSPEELKQMMDEIDKDGDGFIDLKEFADFHHGTTDGSNINGANVADGITELKDAFDMYDKDKNGLISATELHMVLKSLGESCTVHDCEKMIGSVDADGDGNVNFEEFKKMMTNSTPKSEES